MHTNFIYLNNFILETEITEENQPATTPGANYPSATTEEIWHQSSSKESSSEENTEYTQQETKTKQMIHNKHDK